MTEPNSRNSLQIDASIGIPLESPEFNDERDEITDRSPVECDRLLKSSLSIIAIIHPIAGFICISINYGSNNKTFGQFIVERYKAKRPHCARCHLRAFEGLNLKSSAIGELTIRLMRLQWKAPVRSSFISMTPMDEAHEFQRNAF